MKLIRTLSPILLSLIILVSSLWLAIPIQATDTLFDYFDPGVGTYSGQSIYGNTIGCQLFTPSASYSITSVSLLLYRSGSSSQLNVLITPVYGGQPNLGITLTYGWIDASTLSTSTSGAYTNIPLYNYSLTAGTQYAIVVEAAGSVVWMYANTAYGGGSSGSSIDYGTTWGMSPSRGYIFRAYGVPFPGVTTNNADSIQSTSAYLKGTVTGSGTYTSGSGSFEYGSTTSYGSGQIGGRLLPETGVTSVVGEVYYYPLTGLTPNALYHFRAIVNFGGTDYFGADNTFITMSAPGSTTDINIVSVAAFSHYIQTGDLLFTAEIVDKYTGYFPTASAGDYFTVQLLGTNGTMVLGAAPLSNWGDRPSSIYFSAAAVTSQGITLNSLYYISVVSGIGGVSSVTKQLSATSWKGSDLTNLDNWCRGAAYAMGVTDNVVYLTTPTDVGTQINDAGGGYFTTGIPGISSIRPNLFTSSKGTALFVKGSANNQYDTYINGTPVATPWATQVGPKITADMNTFGSLFSTDPNAGRMVLTWVLIGIVVLIMIVGVAAGGKALGLLLLSMPILMYGNFLKVIDIQVTIVFAIIMAFFFVRQFIWKTT